MTSDFEDYRLSERHPSRYGAVITTTLNNSPGPESATYRFTRARWHVPTRTSNALHGLGHRNHNLPASGRVAPYNALMARLGTTSKSAGWSFQHMNRAAERAPSTRQMLLFSASFQPASLCDKTEACATGGRSRFLQAWLPLLCSLMPALAFLLSYIASHVLLR